MTDPETQPQFDWDDISLDAVAKRHDGVEEVIAQNDEYEQKVETFESAFDSLRGALDAEDDASVSDLEDTVETLQEDLSEVREELDEYRESDKQALVDELEERTEYERDELEEMDMDELERIDEIVDRTVVDTDAKPANPAPDEGSEPSIDTGRRKGLIHDGYRGQDDLAEDE